MVQPVYGFGDLSGHQQYPPVSFPGFLMLFMKRKHWLLFFYIRIGFVSRKIYTMG